MTNKTMQRMFLTVKTTIPAATTTTNSTAPRGICNAVAWIPVNPNPLINEEAKFDVPPLITPHARPIKATKYTNKSCNASIA